MTTSENILGIIGVAALLGIGALGGYAVARHLGNASTTELSKATKKALKAASSREDSLRAATFAAQRNDSIAWDAYAQTVRSASHDTIQSLLSRVASRAGGEVSARAPVAVLSSASRSAHDSLAPCIVSLTCSQATDMIAGDSLLRLRLDSTMAVSTLAGASCSTQVLRERSRADSLASLPPVTASLWERIKTGAVGAIAGAALAVVLMVAR